MRRPNAVRPDFIVSQSCIGLHYTTKRHDIDDTQAVRRRGAWRPHRPHRNTASNTTTIRNRETTRRASPITTRR
eukprot:scaffold17774_cov44-Attheya_sp.AAC.3